MIHEKLKNIRKQKGLNQEDMAKILSTDISSYCRKENGKSKIHDDEWTKLAHALNVSINDIKEEDLEGFNHFHDNPNNYYDRNPEVSHSILINLQDYIKILKAENESLKKELEYLKNKS